MTTTKAMSKAEFNKKLASRRGPRAVPFWLNAVSGLVGRGVDKDEANKAIALAREWIVLPLDERDDLAAKLASVITTIKPIGDTTFTKEETIALFVGYVW